VYSLSCCHHHCNYRIMNFYGIIIINELVLDIVTLLQLKEDTSKNYNLLHFWRLEDVDFDLFVCLMALNATFNNISVISWQSVLLVEETGGPCENHWPVASHWQSLSHNVVHLALIEIRTHNIRDDRHWLHR